MNSATVYLTLAMLLAHSMNGRPARTYILGVAIALTLLIGATRVYLGVHWPTDVLAGWAVGAFWALLSTMTATLWQSPLARSYPPTGISS